MHLDTHRATPIAAGTLFLVALFSLTSRSSIAESSSFAAASSLATLGAARAASMGRGLDGSAAALAVTQFLSSQQAAQQNAQLAEHSQEVRDKSKPKAPQMDTFSAPAGPDPSTLKAPAGPDLLADIQNAGTTAISSSDDSGITSRATAIVNTEVKAGSVGIQTAVATLNGQMPNGQKLGAPPPVKTRMQDSIKNAIGGTDGSASTSSATTVASGATAAPSGTSSDSATGRAHSGDDTSAADNGVTANAGAGAPVGSGAVASDTPALVGGASSATTVTDNGGAATTNAQLSLDGTGTSLTGDPTVAANSTTSPDATNRGLASSHAAAAAALNDTVQRAVQRLLAPHH